jgi:peroxiredoxin
MKQIVIVILIVVAGVLFLLMPKDERPRSVVAVGLKAPDFQLKELDIEGGDANKTWKFADLRGKVVFINYWATWCKECREEMPSMQRLHDRMQEKPFQMITILYRDEPEKTIKYMKENDYTMPVLLDPDTDLAFSFGVTGVPETYIIDKDGIVQEKILGPRNWDLPESTVVMESLL